MPFRAWDESSTYDVDKPLFKELGLQEFQGVKNRVKHFVGKVKRDDGAETEIWVEAYPAQFYEFKVKSCEGAEYEVSTGSGCLSSHWPLVQAIMDGMIEVKQLKGVSSA